MTLHTWRGGNGDWSDDRNWILDQHSFMRAGVYYATTGAITATNTTTNGDTILLDTNQHIPVSLTLNGTNLGVGSTTILWSHTGNTNLTLHNSRMEGTVISAVGPSIITADKDATSANDGAIVAMPGSSLTIVDNGNYTNFGSTDAYGGGQVSHVFSTLFLGNFGIITAENGGKVSFDSNAGNGTIGDYGTVQNKGVFEIDNGSMFIDANFQQLAGGRVNIDNNGSLTIQGSTTAGVIYIQSGMLDFPDTPTVPGPGPFGALHFAAAVDFTGPTGSIGFGSSSIQEEFRAASNDVLITTPFEGGRVQLSDIKLVGSYTAADFAVAGSSLVYTAHHGAS